MVGKATSVSSGGAGYDYALGKDEAEILHKECVIAENGAELKEEFDMYQQKNSRCENNNINIILSPSPEDKLTNQDLIDIGKDFMKKMELQDHQYVIVKHTPPSGREHLHIYCNRIDKDGKAYADKYIGKKSQRIAQEIANERGLINVKDIQQNKQILGKTNLKEIRQQIYDKHNEVMEIGKPKDFNNYINQMKKKGVDVMPSVTEKGKIRGFRVNYQGFDLKATEVHKNMSLSRTNLKTDLPKLSKSIGKVKPLDNVIKDVGVSKSFPNIGLGVMKIGVKAVKKIISKELGY